MAKTLGPIKPITGFPEWLPEERIVEQSLLDRIRGAFERFGFAPIETPAVEKNETLESKGEVNKQIYSLYRPNVSEETEKETGLSLHFDLTVPLARYVAQHYGKLVFPFRRYQIQKVWRGERAQKGRFREFYQCDVDIVGEGSLDLLADAEMISIIQEVFTTLDVGSFIIRMSNRKVLQGILETFDVSGETGEEALRAIDRLPKLKNGWQDLEPWLEETLRLERSLISLLRTLLTIKGASQIVLEDVRNLEVRSPFFKKGVAELERVLSYAEDLGVPSDNLQIDLSITRGLDYYTGTVFETFLLEHEKTLGSVCSGGRYEDLASHFTDKKLPGVGLSIGLSRLFAGLLEAGTLKPSAQTPAQVMVTVPNRERLAEVLQLARELRLGGIKVDLFVQEKKHDKQLKSAVRKGIPLAVIPWPNRLDEEDAVEVRDLTSGERRVIRRSELVTRLQSLIGNGVSS